MRALAASPLVVALGCGEPREPGDSVAPDEQHEIVSDVDGDGFDAGEDCDDAEIATHPGADERCNDRDDDCDGDVDEDAIDAIAVYADADADGYGGVPDGTACEPGPDQSASSDDCDDGDAGAHPGAPEICNGGVDDDCDGAADDADGGTGGTSYYADGDSDGYGGGEAAVACAPPPGFLDDGQDCDDADPLVNPDADEICNGVDDDCDPFTTESGMVATAGVPYGSIQDAIDGAIDEGTVFVCEGTWFENLTVVRSVTLEGRGADVSIIDGNADGSVIEVTGRADLVVRGLTLQNGSGSLVGELEETGGGAIQAWAASTLLVESSVMTMSNAAYGGGILGTRTGETTLVDTVVSANSSTHGGGGAFLHSQYSAENVIEGCEFSGNTTLRHGGGVQIDAFDMDGSATITDSLFDSNVAGAGELIGGGGGIHSVCHLDIAGVTISNNVASFAGGAWTGSGVSADDKTEVHGNATAEGGYGGGIVADWWGWDFGHVWNNTATTGGGVVVYGGGELASVVVDGNHATEAGGGVWLDGGTITDCEISSNTSDDVGGGVYVTDYGTMRRVIVNANTATTEAGGAMVVIEQTLTSEDSDWGTGVSDNTPDDLVFLYWDEADPLTYDDVGEDFVCDVVTETCE